MTVREVYNAVLVELNKVQAPSILLEDFVYLLNKSILRYINKRYSFFELNQQLTDDLRVLTTEATLQLEDPAILYVYKLPKDYIHILNCTCVFNTPNVPCGTSPVEVGATKLDTAQLPHVILNFYMKPSSNRPYYYICYKTDPLPADVVGDYYASMTGRVEGTRYGNSQIPIILIKCGSTIPLSVKVTYLRAPKYVELTLNDLDLIDDTTPHLEFPDYVVYEIINELTTLILENGKDPRLQTLIGTSQTIGVPTGKSK